MVTHKEAMMAVKILDSYCASRNENCENCIFYDVLCPCGFTPEEWEKVTNKAKLLEAEEK